MSGLNQFAVYQLKNTPETRQLLFRSCKVLQEKGIQPRLSDYEQVYVGFMQSGDTPEKIQDRFNRQHPRAFQGHSISVSDVLILHEEGTVTAYYVEPEGYAVIEGFLQEDTSESRLSFGTRHFQIKGKRGTWHAFDRITIEEQVFFLMEHEKSGKGKAWAVVDQKGQLVADHVQNGFDQTVRRKIQEYIAQNKMRKNAGGQHKERLKKGRGRDSVLAKLRQKQERIVLNRGKKDTENK